MDTRLNAEHKHVQETARDFIESEGGIELARRQMDGDNSVVDELWDDLTELDYTAITVPLKFEGFGEGMVYLNMLLETAGRYALPGPLPETAAVAAPLITELGTDEQKDRYLPSIAGGETQFSVALYDESTEELPAAVQMEAVRVDGGYRLSGTKTLVPYGDSVDQVVLAARTQDTPGYQGISLFVVDTDAAASTSLKSLDRTRPVSALEFDDIIVDDDSLLGSLHGGGDALARAIDRYSIATAAMLVGAAERTVELSAEYGNERTQYGHPIGRFQAVKHRTSEMWVTTEQARSLTRYAAWAIENEEPDAQQAVAMANAYIRDNLHDVFADDIKNHGGMGFTWDHDTHIYLKQAKAWESYLGSAQHHHERVADSRDYSRRTLPDYPELTTDAFQ